MTMRNDWSFQHKKSRHDQRRLLKRSWADERTWGKEIDLYKEQPTPELAPWNQSTWKKRNNRRGTKRFQRQLVVATMLLTFTVLVFRSPSPVVEPVQEWMTDSLTKETAFHSISAWYERYIGGSPAILPAFLPGKKSRFGSQEEPWLVPVRGELVLPFDQKRKGLILRTAPHASVRAARAGVVEFAGEKKGMGKVVILKHADGQETWYGWLQEMEVKPKEEVKRGQVVGIVPEMKEQAYFYFALKKQQGFVDPMDVVPFE